MFEKFWLHVSGLLIAFAICASLFGRQVEEKFFPIITSVDISNVVRHGGNLSWTAKFCKNRNERLDGSNFVFLYLRNPLNTGIPIRVRNETREAPVGVTPLRSAACYALDYSAILPKDALPGDSVVGEVWYRTFHNFWLIHHDFGEVIVP